MRAEPTPRTWAGDGGGGGGGEMHGGETPASVPAGRVISDFSTTVNAYGPAPQIVSAVRAASFETYPDRRALFPRIAAASLWGCDVNEVAFGAGTTELIYAIAGAYLGRGDIAVVAAPAFGEYRRAAALAGAAVAEVRVFAPGNAPDLFVLHDAIRRLRPKLVFLCNPNSPTGHLLSRDDVAELCSACERNGVLLVLDRSLEAFDGSEAYPFDAIRGATTVLLRSITKDHAMPGLRAGFMRAGERAINAVNACRMPWAASAHAQAGAVAALQADSLAHVQRTTSQLRAASQELQREIAALGFAVAPSGTHFFMVNTGNAARARQRLLDLFGVHVRDCASFGEPAFVRITARTPQDNSRLLTALFELANDIAFAQVHDARATHAGSPHTGGHHKETQ